MTLPGQLVPDERVETPEGVNRSLWDFRQRSHVILLRGAPAGSEVWIRWKKEVEAQRRRLAWLQATAVLTSDPGRPGEPCVELIDRYGRLQTILPVPTGPLAELFEAIEREYIYYEARHC